jgi:hypothetical protein
VIFVLLGLAGAPGLRADIIDRVVAVVGNQAVTWSEVEREARLEAYCNGQPPPAAPSGRSPEYRALLERVIEQRLIQREMDQTKFPPADDAQAKKRLQQLRPAGADAAKYGLREQDLLEYARRIENVDRFLALRFQGTRQAADSELDAWLKDLRSRVGVRILEEEKP